MPTAAMVPTLGPGDHILTQKKAYSSREPMRGDLVVFTTKGISLVPQSEGQPDVIFIKRVVGLPGDRLAIIEGRVWVNGEAMTFGDRAHPVEDRNMGKWLSSEGTKTYVVPPLSYFMLGDNSAQSYDSRYWGPVSRSSILGRVTKVYWPWNRMSTPR